MSENLKGIKNIIFDLGGVILNIDYQRTIDEFEKLGVSNFETIFSQSSQNKISDKFEKGEITEMQFYESIKEISGVEFSFSQYQFAWNAILLDLPQERISLLKELKNKYHLFLFSNTNETHYKKFITHLESDFDMIFEKAYYSHLFGKRKPDKSTFTAILKENKLNPEETLFIDDSVQHIEGAESVDIQSVLLKGKSIIDLFDQ
jgi:putative hydrolase of the HAD superfamily